MQRFLSAGLSALALSLISTGAFAAAGDPIFYDDFNANTWESWTAHFDQAGSVANGDISVSGGQMVFNPVNAGDDAIASTREITANSTITADVTLTAGAAGGYFSFGLNAATAGGSKADCNIYELGGTYYIGVYDAEGGGYGASAVALAPQPTFPVTYSATVTQVGEVVTYTIMDGATTVATTSRDLTGIANCPNFGLLYMKNGALTVSLDNLVIVDNDSSTTLVTDTFDGASIDLKKWFAETNPDVNEGGSGGMRIFNFSSGDGAINAARPDLQDHGKMTIRGGTLAAAGGEFYSRVPSRFGGSYAWFGDVDAYVKFTITPDAGPHAYFSVALDNRTNEGARQGVVVDATNPTAVVLKFADDLGGAKGYGGGGALSFNTVGTPVTLSGFDASADTAYLHISRNGNAVSAFIASSLGGAPITGTASGTLTTANPSGQIVLCAHRGEVKVDDVAVWEYSATPTWALPASTSVSDWTMF